MYASEPRERPPKKRRRHAKVSVGPTLRDVAHTASVSTASASRALSRPELVSEEVRDRVAVAARALAYVPNAAARALSGRPARVVGAVVTTLSDPPTMCALEALGLELATRGTALMLAIAGQGEGAVAGCAQGLRARGADAIVYCGCAMPVDLGEKPPWATLDGPSSDVAPAGSGFDCAGALALAARYLQGLGHVQIALLGLDSDRRIAAIRNALANTGIEIVFDFFGGSVMPSDRLGDVFDRWRTLSAPPTAVVCASDTAAVAVLRECERRNIAVPGQLSVVGYGDSELSRQVRPALSTLRLPARAVAQALTRSLFAALEGRSEPLPELHPKLVVRESTGRASR